MTAWDVNHVHHVPYVNHVHKGYPDIVHHTTPPPHHVVHMEDIVHMVHKEGTDMTELMHITYQLNDHSPAVSLCGIRFVTDHAATDEARATGDWVSCPLCEAANLVNHLRLDTPETEPEPPQHPKRRSSPPSGWTQPAMF